MLKRGAEATEGQRWLKSNVFGLTSALQGATSVAEFGERLVSGLVPMVGGGIAAFYLYEEHPEGLRRIAGYGLPAGAESAATVAVGEGLVGQCARERRTITLADLPSTYVRIESGTGAAAPAQAVAFPLMAKQALLGVLEIAGFRAFTGREQALCEELLPVVGMSLEILQGNLATDELLAQTQEQARQLEEQTGKLTQSQQELLSQKEELLAQQDELTEQRERLSETEQFFRSVLELAPDGLMVVDADGIIQLANAQCEKLFGYTRDELVGQQVEILVPDEIRPQHPALRERRFTASPDRAPWAPDASCMVRARMAPSFRSRSG